MLGGDRKPSLIHPFAPGDPRAPQSQYSCQICMSLKESPLLLTCTVLRMRSSLQTLGYFLLIEGGLPRHELGGLCVPPGTGPEPGETHGPHRHECQFWVAAFPSCSIPVIWRGGGGPPVLLPPGGPQAPPAQPAGQEAVTGGGEGFR